MTLTVNITSDCGNKVESIPFVCGKGIKIEKELIGIGIEAGKISKSDRRERYAVIFDGSDLNNSGQFKKRASLRMADEFLTFCSLDGKYPSISSSIRMC